MCRGYFLWNKPLSSPQGWNNVTVFTSRVYTGLRFISGSFLSWKRNKKNKRENSPQKRGSVLLKKLPQNYFFPRVRNVNISWGLRFLLLWPWQRVLFSNGAGLTKSPRPGTDIWLSSVEQYHNAFLAHAKGKIHNPVLKFLYRKKYLES